jgi:broad specificity phosphatase PhoE
VNPADDPPTASDRSDLSDTSDMPAESRCPSNSDPDMRAIPAALRRAAQRAREIAALTGTAVVVMEGGRLVEMTEAGRTASKIRQDFAQGDGKS